MFDLDDLEILETGLQLRVEARAAFDRVARSTQYHTATSRQRIEASRKLLEEYKPA